LLIKIKQIERDKSEYQKNNQIGYTIIINRMYEVLQKAYDDTDATLRHLQSPEYEYFIRRYKKIMDNISYKQDYIEKYFLEIVHTSIDCYDNPKSDTEMIKYEKDQQIQWEKYMNDNN
jgi:hypothetical protein